MWELENEITKPIYEFILSKIDSDKAILVNGITHPILKAERVYLYSLGLDPNLNLVSGEPFNPSINGEVIVWETPKADPQGKFNRTYRFTLLNYYVKFENGKFVQAEWRLEPTLTFSRQ